MESDRHRQKSLDRQAEAWRLRVQGWTQERIAGHLGCTQQAVSEMLRKVEKRLYAEFVEEAEEIKARQTAQLEHLYDRLASQFEESCEEGSGNPALLAQALKALADVRAIWGLEAPRRNELTGAAGGPIEIDVDATRIELQRRLTRLAAAELAEAVSGEPVAE